MCVRVCVRACVRSCYSRREYASRICMRAEANWSAENEEVGKQEKERQSGFLRDGETRKELEMEKRRRICEGGRWRMPK